MPDINTSTETNVFLDTSGSEEQKIDPNLFKEDNVTIDKSADPDKGPINSYVRRFIISSVGVFLNIILIVVIITYHIYIQQTSQVTINPQYATFIPKYEGYLKNFTTTIGLNHEASYAWLPVSTTWDIVNIMRIINAPDLTYAQKKQLLSDKVSPIPWGIMWEITEIDNIKKDIAKFWFLPQEIKNILEKEEAISTIQRALNALEIIKFSTAWKIFSYLDSTASVIQDAIWESKDVITNFLSLVSARWEKDISAYIHMCYLNPFEISQDCNIIWEFDLYYQSILQDKTFNISLFKSVMKVIDQILEQSEIPNFSILFNGFNAWDESVNFNIEINTTKTDELKLIAKWIKSPHIFILTNLINLLKQSVFIIGADINTSSLDISTRDITIGNLSVPVNSSTKQFNLPIQKNTEREIFDYVQIDEMVEEMLEEKEKEIEEAETYTGSGFENSGSLVWNENLIETGEEITQDYENILLQEWDASTISWQSNP